MLFAYPGKYEPCGLFTQDHFKLIIITIIGITVALKRTINKNKEEIKKIIKKMYYNYMDVSIAQMTLPFYTIYGIKSILSYKTKIDAT